MAICWYDMTTGETAEQRCSFCGGEGEPQVCPGDHLAHHHGAMHEPSGTPPNEWRKEGQYLVSCDGCYPKAVALWDAARAKQRAAQPT